MAITGLDRWAAIAASGLLIALAVLVGLHRYGFIGGEFWQALFWDAKALAAGARYVFQNENPYLAPVYTVPLDLRFTSPPLIAYLFGVASGVLGKALLPLLVLAHIAALAMAPVILTRLFVGRAWTDSALGYALFVGGLGAWGVTAILAGNLGGALYLAIFAAMARGVRSDRWRLFHVVVAAAVQAAPAYVLFWIVPVLAQGWSWRQARYAAGAACAAALPFALCYLLGPEFFRDWLGALSQQARADAGLSMYGAAFRFAGPSSSAPMIAHVLLCGALGVFLLLDRTRGLLKLAALVTFAILANPQMRYCDIAFAAIPAAALYLAALTRESADETQRAKGIGIVAAIMLVMLVADRVPLIGLFVYVIAMTAAILTLAAPALRVRLAQIRAARLS